MDDIIFNKINIIEKCIQRIDEEYLGNIDNVTKNYTKQDSIILNLQRAIQAALDVSMHIVRIKQLGLPQSSRDVLLFLEKSEIISSSVSTNLQKMVGFRNIAVHDYQKINLDIIVAIIENHLSDFQHFIAEILASQKASPSSR